MYLKMERAKPRSWLFTILYRIFSISRRLLPAKTLFRLLLDLEFIFARLAHEQSFRFYKPADHPLRQRMASFAVKRVGPDDTVIDIGSGNGALSAMIAERAKRVTGIEHDRAAVERATAAYPAPNLTFEVGDATAFMQAHGPVDVIVMSHVLEHIADPEALLRLVASNCRLAYVEVPDFEATFKNAARVAVGCKLIYSDADHVTEFDASELELELRNAGLEIIELSRSDGVIRAWCGGITAQSS